MSEWRFYGREEPLNELRRIIDAGRWFFCRIQGRRRIGKTTLLRKLSEASADMATRLVYMQVPDSDERDVAASFRRSLQDSDFALAQRLAPMVYDFLSMADAIAQLCKAGAVVVLDEFQYFTRSQLHPFNSFLQAEVDKLRNANLKRGGLFVLGSLQTEMNALLSDKAAPLYGRITSQIQLGHWDFEDLLQVFDSQGVRNPFQWLTLWTFFEGVPKFYHDAYEQGIFDLAPEALAPTLLTRLFLRSSSPLAEEADTWFLRELRGKSVSILHFLAEHPGCAHADILAALSHGNETTLSQQIGRLVNNFHMIDKLQPVFSDAKSRNARYYITDNFLKTWLAVIKPAREAARLKPVEKVLPLALTRLCGLEGFAFEKLIRQLHVETARKGKGDFALSDVKLGYWNRARDAQNSIEIDVVALDQDDKRIRFGACKRAASAHDGLALKKFDEHVAAFLQTREYRHIAAWQIEKVLFAPLFDAPTRALLSGKGYRCLDLLDYASLFQTGQLHRHCCYNQTSMTI